MKLHVNDQVIVTTGKDKGIKGKITLVLPKDSAVIVEGVNKFKRHVKRRSDKEPGGIVAVERPLNVAKVALVCPQCKKITRVGYQKVENGEKIRICRKCGQAIGTKK